MVQHITDRAAVLLIGSDALRGPLADAGVIATVVAGLDDALAALRGRGFDAIVTGLRLPDAAGLDAVRRLRLIAGAAPLIVVAGADDEELALRALHEGADDYLVDGLTDGATVRRTLRHAREHKQLVGQLAHLTRHDVLTGAVNRVGLRDHVEARRHDGRFALLALDLDHFKAVNDAFGHDAGDAVLCAVAARLAAVVGPTDVVARTAGDRFAIVVDDVGSPLGLRALAERVRAQIAQPIPVPGGTAAVTATIGIACYPDVATRSEHLLDLADAAVQHGKRRGRDRVQLAERPPDQRLAADVQHALERGELVLHFQPQVEVARQRLVGFEALLRWQRPRAGGVELVAPAEFIPLLEDSGRIVAVGEWAIERACAQLAAWRSAGRPEVRIAVNLAAQQFEGGGLVAWTRHCLRRHDVPARCLELEITESRLMADTAQSSAMIAALRGLGVRLAIDDFGTGFSSLAYLNQLAVDCLKIDRSLIEQVHASGDGEAITRSIIGLAHDLGLEVVAEGVETDAQLACLADARCDVVQGYLIGRPAPASAFDGSALWAMAPPPRLTVRIRPLRLEP